MTEEFVSGLACCGMRVRGSGPGWSQATITSRPTKFLTATGTPACVMCSRARMSGARIVVIAAMACRLLPNHAMSAFEPLSGSRRYRWVVRLRELAMQSESTIKALKCTKAISTASYQPTRST